MRLSHIVKIPILPTMTREVKRFRAKAPDYLQHVIERTKALETVRSLEELSKKNLKVLTSGRYSAVFFFWKPTEQAVIKLRSNGLFAEAEALGAWEEQGVRVVKIKQVGEIKKETRKKVRYMVQEAVTEQQGEPAPTALQYVLEHPEKLKTIGKMMGRELAKMHRAKTERTFGEFSDMPGKNSPFKSWNAYLITTIETKKKWLKIIGMEASTLREWKKKLEGFSFSGKKVYLHGDFTLRNVLVEKNKPLTLRIIDPNPIVGDPAWDLANRLVNEEISWHRAVQFPKKKEFQAEYIRNRDLRKALFRGYEEEAGEEIRHKDLLATLPIHLLIWFTAEYERIRKLGKDPLKDKEVLIRKETLLESVRGFIE